MDRDLIQKMHHHYKKANLDIMKAVRTWNDLEYSPEKIAEQVKDDVGRSVTAQQAEELYHLGASMKNDYEMLAKNYEVSKGREDLIPENIKQDKIKLSPAIRMAMDRVGANLFRHKTAKTYWTMKEKLGDNGAKEVYLVAVDEPDEIKKEASIKKAAPLGVELVKLLQDPAAQDAIQQYGEKAKQYIQQYGQQALDTIKQQGAQVLESWNQVSQAYDQGGIPAAAQEFGQQAVQNIKNVGQGVYDYFTGGNQQQPAQPQQQQPVQAGMIITPDGAIRSRTGGDDYKSMFRKPKTKSQMKGKDVPETFGEDLPENLGVEDIKGRAKRNPKSIHSIPNEWDDVQISDASKKHKTKPKEKDFPRESIKDMELEDIGV